MPTSSSIAHPFALSPVTVAFAKKDGMPSIYAPTNVPQLFRYREYRRKPEAAAFLTWRPNFVWALLTALALVVSLFGMWQRVEFLYFQF